MVALTNAFTIMEMSFMQVTPKIYRITIRLLVSFARNTCYPKFQSRAFSYTTRVQLRHMFFEPR